MAGNSFGNLFRITIFGETHGSVDLSVQLLHMFLISVSLPVKAQSVFFACVSFPESVNFPVFRHSLSRHFRI